MFVWLGWVLGALVVGYALFLVAALVGHDAAAFPGAGKPAESPGAEFVREELHLELHPETGAGGTGADTVHAWWIADAPGQLRTLLYFHGNGYALEDEAELEAPMLQLTGANLLLMDYRGYGTSSPAKPSAATTAADARAGLRHLTEERGIPLSEIWICGRSIGSTVAVRLAAEFPDCAGLVLISPLTNTVDVWPFGPALRPLRWLGLAKAFDSRTRITGLRLPVLIVTGTRDTVGTPAMAAELHRRAAGPKRLELVDGAGHNTICQIARERIPQLIREMMMREMMSSQDIPTAKPTS